MTVIPCPSCGKRNRIGATPAGVPRCSVCHTNLPWVLDATADSFDTDISASVPVLVDFWAPWCGPCRALSPLVEKLGVEHAGHLKLVKLNVDQAQAIAQRYGVQGIPLLLLLKDGEPIDRLVGAVPEGQLRAWLEPRLTQAGAPAMPDSSGAARD